MEKLATSKRKQIRSYNSLIGSLGIAVKMPGFGGESVGTHALNPKSGVIPRQILKNPLIAHPEKRDIMIG